MKQFLDARGTPLTIGDTVCFISGPNSLNVGTLTGFKSTLGRIAMCEVVVQVGSETKTLSVLPYLSCKL